MPFPAAARAHAGRADVAVLGGELLGVVAHVLQHRPQVLHVQQQQNEETEAKQEAETVELIGYRTLRRPSDLSPSQQRRHLNGTLH